MVGLHLGEQPVILIRAQRALALGTLVDDGAGGPGGSNVLVERFLEVDEFNDLYEQRLAELSEILVESVLAESILDEWAEVLADQAGDLISEETLAAEVDRLSEAL